ncbi:glycoside hydrolase family 65 protein [Crystallibacter crystallopoietes]|uniref:glycoside hydrolase family 65 protein n=1 Tax=Crystallibacter crystallopoietes TaxID=37928 RepID=UPI0009D936F3|nr:glycosyl hydrolase family 65 protein [Arthrobacter crystallopoietes]
MANRLLTTHPWQVRESSLDADSLGLGESVFALANGYVGLRGTLDEGQPSAARGVFLAGVYEYHPLSYPEGGYGHPEHGQAMIGVADGTGIRLQVDGVPLDVREAPAGRHERVLDLRAGTLRREFEWTTPRGGRMRLVSTRMVSLAHRATTAIRYEVQALDQPVQIAIRSELTVNCTPPPVDNSDPRVEEALHSPFESCLRGSHQTGGHLVHRTRRSGTCVAAAVEHEILRPEDAQVHTTDGEDQVATSLVAELPPGGTAGFVKYICHAWSREDPPAGLRDQAAAALEAARQLGWEGLAAEQQRVLDNFWQAADVEVDGDPDLQQALRFDLFQLLQASACVNAAPVGAKGLTGYGYSGHTFWDIDSFLVPAMTLLRPEDAARMLRWRSSGLDRARERAQVLGLEGASFPWRTIDGGEASAYWPASTAAAHLNADIARAFGFWADATGRNLEEVGGLDVLVETARVWARMLHRDHKGRCHLYGMTGPDEYTGVVDDNVFTNLMAKRNLDLAADACEANPAAAQRLRVSREEKRHWREAADAMYVPYDHVLGVHPANEGFTTYREWDFEGQQGAYPVQDHAHYAKIYRRQVVKQADLELALWWCSDAFTPEEAARNLDYYERRTVRDSSLSAAAQAVACAHAGHLDLALAYLREAALVDLRDLQQDSQEGLHLASLAGAWLALACGLGGLQTEGGKLQLAPRLPARLERIAFRLQWRGHRLGVETTPAGTTMRLLDTGTSGTAADEAELTLSVDGTDYVVAPGRPAKAPLHAAEPLLQRQPSRQGGNRTGSSQRRNGATPANSVSQRSAAASPASGQAHHAKAPAMA